MVSECGCKKLREVDVGKEEGVGTEGGDNNALPCELEGGGGGEEGGALGRREGRDVDGGDEGEEGENGGREGEEEFETKERESFLTGFSQDMTRFEARGGTESDGFEVEDVAFERAGREREGKEEERKREGEEKEDWEENAFVLEENFEGIGEEFKEERKGRSTRGRRRRREIFYWLILVMYFGHCFSPLFFLF